ncbi:hypothetical protein BHM03_00021942 [Ensete ventricosum]|nr:hypothetical protein BHM03_00021942 [Ensete ventricosum]
MAAAGWNRDGSAGSAGRNGRGPMKRRGGIDVADGSGRDERKAVAWGRRWRLGSEGRRQQRVMWEEVYGWAMKRRGGIEVVDGSGREEKKVAAWGRRWRLGSKGRKMAEAAAAAGAIGVARGQRQQWVRDGKKVAAAKDGDDDDDDDGDGGDDKGSGCGTTAGTPRFVALISIDRTPQGSIVDEDEKRGILDHFKGIGPPRSLRGDLSPRVLPFG